MKRGLATLAACAVLIGMQACSRGELPPQVPRLGVPPHLLSVFEGGAAAGLPATRFVGLRPYERARDLEVLLFASRSPVFQGIVLPGRWAPLLRAWSEPFPEQGLGEVRPDVVSSLRVPGGLLAVPLTLDGILLAYRPDLWAQFEIPPPRSLAALREAALVLRSRARGLDRLIESDVPADQLFWAVAWSYEGRSSGELYSYPKVHALRFIQEFGLVPEAAGPTGEDLFSQGRCAALFCTAEAARRLARAGGGGGPPVRIARVPGLHERSHCIYNGWCLARPSLASPETSGWARMASPDYQGYLASRGYTPVMKRGQPSRDEVAAAFGGTVFHGAPDLGPAGDEVVLGAVLDASRGPMTAEAALRRAQARLGGGAR